MTAVIAAEITRSGAAASTFHSIAFLSAVKNSRSVSDCGRTSGKRGERLARTSTISGPNGDLDSETLAPFEPVAEHKLTTAVNRLKILGICLREVHDCSIRLDISNMQVGRPTRTDDIDDELIPLLERLGCATDRNR